MNNSTRQKVVRAIVGALVSGPFSEIEIEEIARSLATASDVGPDLSGALNAIGNNLRISKRFDKKAPRAQSTNNGPLREALSILKATGTSRRELADIVASIDPGMGPLFDEKKRTFSDLLTTFFKANSESAEFLLSRLRALPHTPTGPEDPYLKLIDKKLER